LETLNVLRGGLPTPTSNIQLLKSRSGLALSLFNFCRFVRPLVFSDYGTNILRKRTPCIPTAARADLRQQDSEAGGFTPASSGGYPREIRGLRRYFGKINRDR